MVDALVHTKLVLPHVRGALVARPRLTDVLARAGASSLVLVSAPAGFGKTTLLAAALRKASAADPKGHPVAWVSLDARDGDGRRFWACALQALEAASPGAAGGALGQLEAGRGQLEDVVTSLVNELSVRPGELTLVLDDYHLADTPEVSRSLSFLLEHRPPQLRLVISTREDPALPLPRFRARGELVEIRAADLRFTEAEVGSFLNLVHGLALSDGDVQALGSRTEGWVAALQLAALSLRGRDDATDFIATFAGDDRFVVDYLVDEVLDQQPSDLRRFLLDTSILERLSGPLCDAVLEGEGGSSTLETLERRNLLLIPLDDRRQWYRYHHLFADVLHARLLAERPQDLPVLHRRASRWHQQAGHLEAAVRHAFAANDVEQAADLIEVAAPSLRRERAEGTLVAWLAQVPSAVLAHRPVLASSHVGALMAANVYDGVEEKLDALESALATPPDGLVIRDRAEWERLPAQVETQRAGLALVKGDLPATIRHAEAALARAGTRDQLTRASASALKGLAAWSAGDLGMAHQSYVAARDGLLATGHLSDALGCTVTLVDLEVQLGRLDAAHRSASHALDMARAGATSSDPVRGTADMWVALARVAWERGDSGGVEDHLHRAAELGDAAGLPQQPYRWRVSMAQLREAQGDLASAAGLLREAERLFNSDFSPDVRPVPATRARFHIRIGDLAAARGWAEGAGVVATDDVTYLREYEHVTLARLLLAEHAHTGAPSHLEQARALLSRVRESAHAAGRTAVTLETLILLAVGHDLGGRTRDALDLLEQAVALAQPAGWVRPFVDEGQRVRRLLGLLPDGVVHASLHRHLTSAASPVMAAPRSDGASLLVAPLSSRELDVLRLLASDLDGPAIARHLDVSLATVRTHTQRIYTKLGVNNRRAAVRRGHQLNL